MRTVSKRIWRTNYESAAAAMVKHEEVMRLKGWRLTQQFGGYKGVGYEFITHFTK